MTNFGITHRKFKSQFFTRVIPDKANAATYRGLARFGALTRTKARRSIVKRKRSSTPGMAPSSHDGRLRRNIFFGHDRARQSVVIGPAATKAHRNTNGILQRGLATEVLEYGGQVGVVEVYSGGKWWPVNHRRTRRPGERRRVRWVKMKPRPYMGPAFKSTAPLVSDFWKDSIK